MKFFSKNVDTRSRQAMVDFLIRHHRYATMNSWNRSSSYSHQIKIHRLGLTSEQSDKAYDLISADDSIWDELHTIIDDFTVEMNGAYTICTNGRSAGYLVLLHSRYEGTGYKSYCRTCRQRNYKTIAETGHNTCGRCHAFGDKGRADFLKEPFSLQTYPGKNIDQGEAFDAEQWSMAALRDRVRLVRRFDAACDDIRGAFIGMLEDYSVIEETVMVPTKRKTFVSNHADSLPS